MFFITWVFFLLTAAAATATAQEHRGGYIVGGHDSSVEKHPSIVQLERYREQNKEWRTLCGGTIIADSYILSAAHCLRNQIVEADHLRIRAGTSSRGKGGDIFYIKSYLIHPNYDHDAKDADIILLALKKPLTWSNVVQPANITVSGKELLDDCPVQVAGWGNTIPGTPGSKPAVLQEVSVYTVNYDKCKNLFRHIRRITGNMVCAGILDVGGKDACQGDSGGPMYDNDVLVGIVSWGQGCAQARYPGVYTKVSAFTDWIESNIV